MTRTLAIEAEEPLESLVDRIYRNRFPREVLARRSAVWRVLCDSWFSRYIPADGRVLEVAAGLLRIHQQYRRRASGSPWT